MKTLLLAMCVLIPQLAISETTDHSALILVRAKIVSMPKDFEFPGSEDADGKEQTVNPHKAHSSELQIVTPKELAGKNVTFYHLPSLTGKTIWHQVGTIIEFRIDGESLGRLYPPKDRRHTFKTPYAHNIAGEIIVIQKPEPNKPRHATASSRSVEMISRNYNPKPVSVFRRRW